MSPAAASTFTELSDTFAQASAQLKCLANNNDNSGVAQGDAIVKALNDVNSRLGNIEKSVADLRQEFTNFRDKAAREQRENDLLREKAANEKGHQDLLREKAIAHNTIARKLNACYGPESFPLQVLRDERTNELIPDFPSASTETYDLGDAEVVKILQAMGKADSGNRHDNLEALDRAIGIET